MSNGMVFHFKLYASVKNKVIVMSIVFFIMMLLHYVHKLLTYTTHMTRPQKKVILSNTRCAFMTS
jgi:hypothetical protein